MTTSTGHPVERRGEPRQLYLASMAARLAGAALAIATCIALGFDQPDLWAALGLGAIVLYIASAALRRRAWWHLSLEEQEAAREPVWVPVTMEAGYFVAFCALPVGAWLSDDLYSVVVTMLVLCGAAGAVTAIAITHRKQGARAGRVIGTVRAVALTALALVTPTAVVAHVTAANPGTFTSNVAMMLPLVLVPYLGVLIWMVLHDRARRRRQPPTLAAADRQHEASPR